MTIWRQGEVIKEHGPNIFHIETTINTNAFGYDGPLSMLQKREWEWNSRDRMKFMGMQAGLKAMTTRAKRKAFMDWRSPYEMTSVQAGDVDKVHEITLEKVLEQHITPLVRTPLHLAVQRALDHEPSCRHVLGLGLHVQLLPR